MLWAHTLRVLALGSDEAPALKPGSSAPFNSAVNASDPAGQRSRGIEQPPGSRRARRPASDSGLEAVGARAWEESAPPTQPSIAPAASRVALCEPSLAESAPRSHREPRGSSFAYIVVPLVGSSGLGAGGLLAALTVDPSVLGRMLTSSALGVLGFSSMLAGLIAFWYLRRLSALANAARQLARAGTEGDARLELGDPTTALARYMGEITEARAALSRQIERQRDLERERIEGLVRERTRRLTEENEDLRRLLGPSKTLFSVDAGGRILACASGGGLSWLGPAPEGVPLWEYLQRDDREIASRFEAAFRDMLRGLPEEMDLRRMPMSVALGERYLALEYQAVQAADGRLERLLVLLTDITVPISNPPEPA